MATKAELERYGEFVARAVAESAGRQRPGFTGPAAVAMACADLWGIARTLGVLAVKQCNDPGYGDKDARRVVALEGRAAELCARMGFDVLCNAGDPRGAAVLVLFPSGITNDWGKRGWALVP